MHLEDGLEVVNPYQYICTLNSSYSLDLHLMISSPEVNQGLDYIDPKNPISLTNKNPLKLREEEINNIYQENKNSFLEKLKNTTITSFLMICWLL